MNNQNIKNILNTGKTTLSYELFPPKANMPFDEIYAKSAEIAKLKPDFMSITYGAGGGISENTVKVASYVKNQLDVTAIAHLTCVSSTKETIDSVINELCEHNISNILALRGDVPDGMSADDGEFKYASDLIKYIKTKGNFCIGGACYPDAHPESLSREDDILQLKNKVDCGLDFLTTQMFFDNNVLYNFLYRIRENGITVPVLAGIMPVTNGKQIDKICKLSGTYLPTRFKTIIDKFGNNKEAMMQAGIAYASEQIIDLIANGVNGIHVYTMNNPQVARSIKNNIDKILEAENAK